MVGGNIAGKTRVLTTSVVLETSIGRLDVALRLGLVLLTISLLTAFCLQLIQFVRFFEQRSLGEEKVVAQTFEPFVAHWQNLTVERDGMKIIDSCSLEISGGEIVALMGESGFSYETLLRISCTLAQN